MIKNFDDSKYVLSMLLEKIERALWRYSCDWCKKEFFTRAGAALNKRQCCSRSCGSKASRQQVRETLMERYGVINAGQIPEVREQVKQTCLERYNVECSWQSEKVKQAIRDTIVLRYGEGRDEIKNRIIQTCIIRYGVENPFQNKEIREKGIQTLVKRFGVDNPQKSKDIQEKTKHTCLERYGVENPLSSVEIREQIRQTNLERHGVEYTSQRDDVKQRIKQTCLTRYGVEHPMQNPEIQKRAIDSCKGKGRSMISKIETECFIALQTLFGFEDVFDQISINKWLIDIYVKSIDTFVQIDGIYWHGFSRSKELLENPISKRDKDISRKWKRDQEQNLWFKENHKKLVRFTDKELLEWVGMDIMMQKLSEVLK